MYMHKRSAYDFWDLTHSHDNALVIIERFYAGQSEGVDFQRNLGFLVAQGCMLFAKSSVVEAFVLPCFEICRWIGDLAFGFSFECCCSIWAACDAETAADALLEVDC